jgi:predicted GNAT superfamily acetyltransferase
MSADLPGMPPEALDFTEGMNESPSSVWTKAIDGRQFNFSIQRTVEELKVVETLQREAFGLSDLDIVAPTALVMVEETGGFVLCAFDIQNVRPVGTLVTWGGFVNRRPVLFSDFMVVRREYRSLGLGFEMKRLQAALAVERGFEEVRWTVDPLRAANARMNFERLGAVSERYERNRYGENLALDLYGDMPTDRLHLRWLITTDRVQQRLSGSYRPLEPQDLLNIPPLGVASPNAPVVTVAIPADIDETLKIDPADALGWRTAVRGELETALERGYIVTGFVRNLESSRSESALVLQAREAFDGA